MFKSCTTKLQNTGMHNWVKKKKKCKKVIAIKFRVWVTFGVRVGIVLRMELTEWLLSAWKSSASCSGQCLYRCFPYYNLLGCTCFVCGFTLWFNVYEKQPRGHIYLQKASYPSLIVTFTGMDVLFLCDVWQNGD